jgi:hypothetical protein
MESRPLPRRQLGYGSQGHAGEAFPLHALLLCSFLLGNAARSALLINLVYTQQQIRV